MTPIKLLRIG